MTHRKRVFGACISLALLLAWCGCASGASGSGAASASVIPTASPGSGASGGTVAYTCPSATTSSGPLNCTALPLGDRKYSSTPQQGYIYTCNTPTGSPAVSAAPWLDTTNGTWNVETKDIVEGSHSFAGTFSESVSGTTRSISSNGLPESPWTTGTFPISPSDPAYQYDRNPNTITAQNFNFTVPAHPTIASTPTCLTGGPIGITITGVAVFDGFDAAGYDAVAREVQDGCHGHPDQSGTYHVHGYLQTCVPDAGSPTQNSSLLGYAADGFGIYGPWYNGKILTTADLDECHGTTSPVEWDGQFVTMYHYVSTYDFPYTLGCYRGTPTFI
ncbi:MAG: YHYH protein [Candidatus Eremiobacteraeota bacterium]|nr:YHYH protein [Candidatus Eremiobacteraeota bacterium]